jgi:hypothetical protein
VSTIFPKCVHRWGTQSRCGANQQYKKKFKNYVSLIELNWVHLSLDFAENVLVVPPMDGFAH